MTAALLEARGISVEFHESRGFLRGRRILHAVQDVSLVLHRGEVLGIVGESGSGKSTLALVLLGLLTPTAGQVLVDGVPIGQLGRAGQARRMQPVFQNPYAALNPARSVGAALRQPLDVHRVGPRAARAALVRAVMQRVGLPARLEQAMPSELSGGQRQRVAIGRAIILRPDILICDEPTSALDVSVQAQILNLLQDLRAQAGLSYLIISHNLAVIEHVATMVMVMYLGRAVETAPAGALFKEPLHPYSQTLQAAVLTPDPTLGLPDAEPDASPGEPGAGCPYAPRCRHVMPVCWDEMPQPRRVREHHVSCHLYPATSTPATSTLR